MLDSFRFNLASYFGAFFQVVDLKVNSGSIVTDYQSAEI